MTDTSSKFFRPPTNADYRVTYMHGFLDGCSAGRDEYERLIGSLRLTAALSDPELEKRRQTAEVEILEAEARLRKATADLRELEATRRKRASEKQA